MARTLRRLLAATALSASLVAGAATPAVAAPPKAEMCIEVWVIQIGDVWIIIVQCVPAP